MRLGIPLIAFSVCVLAGYAEVRPQTKNNPNGFDLVDKSGNIRKPANVRDSYQSLGAYLVLDPMFDRRDCACAGCLAYRSNSVSRPRQGRATEVGCNEGFVLQSSEHCLSREFAELSGKQEATNDSSYQTRAYQICPAAKTAGIWESNSRAA
jgi:hypothetical protein